MKRETGMGILNRRVRTKRSNPWIVILWVSLFFALALHLPAQSATETGPRTMIITTSGQPLLNTTPTSNSTLGSSAPGSIYREIDDLHTGDRWLLLRDANNPAGPGRLVLAGKAATASASNPEQKPSLPVIHRGDSLIVFEESAAVSEQLEAVALEPAAEGSIFQLRLKIGGRTYRAIATGAGRARFAEGQGAQ
jgi:hypothetical protein